MNKSTLKGLALGPVGKLVVTGNSGNEGSMKGGRVGGWEGGRVGGWVGGWCGAVQVGSNIGPSPVLYYRLELLYFFVLFQGMFGGENPYTFPNPSWPHICRASTVVIV